MYKKNSAVPAWNRSGTVLEPSETGSYLIQHPSISKPRRSGRLKPSWTVLDRPGTILDRPGPYWDHPGPSWTVLGPSWTVLDRPGIVLDRPGTVRNQFKFGPALSVYILHSIQPEPNLNWFLDGPRWSQNGPGWSQDGPGWSQDGPGWSRTSWFTLLDGYAGIILNRFRTVPEPSKIGPKLGSQLAPPPGAS